MVTIIIIGAVLIALIVGYTLHRQRKLHQLYQDKPIERVTNFDLEVDIKGGQAVGGYERRKSRMWVLMWAAIAAVIVVGAAICGIMKWNAGAEQRQIAKAEKQRLEKLKQAEEERLEKQNEDEFLAWVDDNASGSLDAEIRKRFYKAQKNELSELQAKINKLNAEKAKLTAEWQKGLQELDSSLKMARDSLYYSCLENLQAEQAEITAEIETLQKRDIGEWQGEVLLQTVLWMLLWGFCSIMLRMFLGEGIYWLSALGALIFLLVRCWPISSAFDMFLIVFMFVVCVSFGWVLSGE